MSEENTTSEWSAETKARAERLREDLLWRMKFMQVGRKALKSLDVMRAMERDKLVHEDGFVEDRTEQMCRSVIEFHLDNAEGGWAA